MGCVERSITRCTLTALIIGAMTSACGGTRSYVYIALAKYSFEPEGTAGIEVVWMDGEQETVFSAFEFAETTVDGSPHIPRFVVDDEGPGRLTMSYRDSSGATIAEGYVDVELAPERVWTFIIVRGEADSPPLRCPSCNDRPVMIPVVPEAARSPTDVFWISWGSRTTGNMNEY